MDEKLIRIQQAVRNRDYRQAAVLVEEGLQANPSIAQGMNIGFAHWLLLGTNWRLITQLLPQGTNFFVESGFLNSLAIGKPVDKNNEPVPWFTYPAIDFLDSRLNADWKVLEYGSGQSTHWWSKRVAKVHAIEHDPKWYEIVKSELPTNAAIELCAGKKEYVEIIATSCGDDTFDVVVIDGEFRNECAHVVSPYIHEDGIIVFDNSDRQMYHDGLEYLLNNGWKRIDFFGLIPSYLYKNCTSIFYRNDNWLSKAPLPADQVLSTGITCSQAIGE